MKKLFFIWGVLVLLVIPICFACEDECTAYEYKCHNGLKLYCGHWDDSETGGDSCVEWGVMTDPEECACEHECTAYQYRCVGNDRQYCGHWDDSEGGDSCVEWGVMSECGECCNEPSTPTCTEEDQNVCVSDTEYKYCAANEWHEAECEGEKKCYSPDGTCRDYVRPEIKNHYYWINSPDSNIFDEVVSWFLDTKWDFSIMLDVENEEWLDKIMPNATTKFRYYIMDDVFDEKINQFSIWSFQKAEPGTYFFRIRKDIEAGWLFKIIHDVAEKAMPDLSVFPDPGQMGPSTILIGFYVDGVTVYDLSGNSYYYEIGELVDPIEISVEDLSELFEENKVSASYSPPNVMMSASGGEVFYTVKIDCEESSVCVDNKLAKQVCKDKGADFEIITCPYGCSEGKCNENPGSTKGIQFNEAGYGEDQLILTAGDWKDVTTIDRDFYVSSGDRESSIGYSDTNAINTVPLWQIYLNKIGFNGQFGWYKSLSNYGPCLKGVCAAGLECEEPACMDSSYCPESQEANIGEDGCQHYTLPVYREYWDGCEPSAGEGSTNGFVHCWGGCRCNNPDFLVNNCYNGGTTRCYSPGSGGWINPGREIIGYEGDCGGLDCGAALEQNYGFEHQKGISDGISYDQYYKSILDEDDVGLMLDGTRCWMEGQSLRNTFDYSKEYKVEGVPRVNDDRFECFILYEEWRKQTTDEEGRRAESIGPDAAVIFDFSPEEEFSCQESDKVCYGKAIFECSGGDWEVSEACLQGCDENACQEIDFKTVDVPPEFDFDLKIEETTEETKKVELIDGDKVVVEFDFDFSDGRLDFGNFVMEQGGDSLLVKGLDLGNNTKTVYVDKVSTGSKICVLDAEIDSLDEMTADCSGEDEVMIDCPSEGNYSCEIVDGRFKVSGLSHSAVKELLYCGDGSCNNGESCSSCSSDCGSCPAPPSGGGGGGGSRRTKKTTPAVVQPPEPVCEPNWQCGDWEGMCDDGFRTRLCEDGCGQEKIEKLECQMPEPEVVEETIEVEPAEDVGVGEAVGMFDKVKGNWYLIIAAAAVLGILGLIGWRKKLF